MTPLQNGLAPPPRDRDWEVFLYAMGYAGGPVKVGHAYNVGYRLKTLSKEESVNLVYTTMLALWAGTASRLSTMHIGFCETIIIAVSGSVVMSKSPRRR